MQQMKPSTQQRNAQPRRITRGRGMVDMEELRRFEYFADLDNE